MGIVAFGRKEGSFVSVSVIITTKYIFMILRQNAESSLLISFFAGNGCFTII